MAGGGCGGTFESIERHRRDHAVGMALQRVAETEPQDHDQERPVVTLTPHGKDRYGRLLADVHFKDQWVNLQMVALGAAWRYDAYSRSEHLLTAQKSAQKAKRGLWSLPAPVSPWVSRVKIPKS